MPTVGEARSGPIALVGSGEYLPPMGEVDALLLEQVGGRSTRVVVLATAAGLEHPSSPQRWARMGVEHFARLGARAESVGILVREDAFDPNCLALLEAADFVYFSGGSPQHLIESLEHSPAWDVIRARHAAGAALAGCSAGAMAFGGFTLHPRSMWRAGGDGRGEQPQPAARWHAALGLVPRGIILPHFDRWAARMGQAALLGLSVSVPAGTTLVGVDEDTALVALDGSAAAAGPYSWQVMGRRTVTLFDGDRGETRYAAGARIELDIGAAQ